jgi:hypothetical protein
MSHTFVRGGVVALIVALLSFGAGWIGLSTLWPVYLAAAVVFGSSSAGVGVVAAYLVGIGTAWLAIALRAGVFPDLAASHALIAVIAVVILTAVAVLTRDQAPLWVGLAGFAAFYGFYEPTFVDSPTTFLADSPVALGELLLASALGFIGGVLADLVMPVRERATAPARVEGGVA